MSKSKRRAYVSNKELSKQLAEIKAQLGRLLARGNGPASFSLRQFCNRHGIRERHYYQLQAEGRAPRTMTIGNEVRISRQAEADWISACENPARPTTHSDKILENLSKEDRWISPLEARTLLGVGRTQFSKIRESGALTVRKIGYRTLRFSLANVRAYIDGG